MLGFLLLTGWPTSWPITRWRWRRSPWCSFSAAATFDGLPPERRLTRRYAAAFVASLVMAFLLGFFLEATLGLIGFWLLEVSSLLFVYMLFNFFFSGHMFPLDMLPRPGRAIVQADPAAVPGLFPGGRVSGQDPGRQLG